MNILHKITIVLFLMLNAYMSIGQTQKYNDKVYLKNETRLVGKVIQYIPNDTLKLELKNGQIVVLHDNTVRKLVMGDADEKTGKVYAFKEKGIYNASYFGLSFGKTQYDQAVQGAFFSTAMGYQFNRLIGVGLGIGIDNQYIARGSVNVLTTFMEVRGYLSAKPRTFYYSCSGGVGFLMMDKTDRERNYTGHRGDLMLHPAIGLRFGANPDFNFFLDIGAKFQRIHFNEINNWAENRYTVTYQRWVLRGGILF
jgi:hypothetical protein